MRSPRSQYSLCLLRVDGNAPPTTSTTPTPCARSMLWLAELNGNPGNRFVGFASGRHGTEIFAPHPELVRQPPGHSCFWLSEVSCRESARGHVEG